MECSFLEKAFLEICPLKPSFYKKVKIHFLSSFKLLTNDFFVKHGIFTAIFNTHFVSHKSLLWYAKVVNFFPKSSIASTITTYIIMKVS